MTHAAEGQTSSHEIALEYELDAAPDKVWRAIVTPAFREQWLPQRDLAGSEPIVSIPGVEVRYRMRNPGGPPLKSTVTFRIGPGREGGTVLKVIHRIEDRAARASVNDNAPLLSLAA